jgi:hypothetical protein
LQTLVAFLGKGARPAIASTVVMVLPKPMCALSSSTPRTLAMPAPGLAVICRPGIAFSHMPLSAPPRGTHTPPCGPVMNVSCWAEAAVLKKAAVAAARTIALRVV